jgi:RNA polymerase sigma-70 factor, ECF subfamily
LTRDEDAEFTALVRRRSHFAFRVAYAVLLNSADAEDAVQESFLKLHRHGGWQHVENERAFLARIVWRTSVDHLRSARTISRLQHPQEPLLDAPSPQPGPEETLMAADDHALIHSLIDTLPDDLRVPLVLTSAQELNSREIALILDIPEGTVRTRLQRARHVLRHKLEAMLDRGKEARNA